MVKFYLEFIIYKKYLQNDSILLDIYYNVINDIYLDFINYDNTKKSLIESIEDYIENKKDFILEKINACID